MEDRVKAKKSKSREEMLSPEYNQRVMSDQASDTQTPDDYLSDDEIHKLWA